MTETQIRDRMTELDFRLAAARRYYLAEINELIEAKSQLRLACTHPDTYLTSDCYGTQETCRVCGYVTHWTGD